MNDNETQIRAEYDSNAELMTNPALYGTAEMVKLSKRQAELQPLVEIYNSLHKLEADLESNQQALKDPELAELAREETSGLEHELQAVKQKLQLALVPKD